MSTSGAAPDEETLEPTSTTVGAVESAPSGHVDDFDFLVGNWRVRHRRLVGRLVGSTTWEEFDGECRMQKVLSGQVNIDDNVLYAPGGTYRAAALRVFDPTNNAWSIFWIDSRYPPSTIDNPVVGGFQDRRGVFFCDDEWEGRQVRTRFIWHVDGPDSCRWEQAFSTDGGRTWETNWYMDFERMASRPGIGDRPALAGRLLPAGHLIPPAADGSNPAPSGHAGDFDFLVGSWHVRHRCLVRSRWQEFDGEHSMRKLLGGQANFDENIWTTATGINRAVALRIFDPKRGAWSIFWLDTRWPTTFGPPVIGGFDGNHGVFFGHDRLEGRPIRVRFHWFVDTPDSCRWEQAFSLDAGATWETNWHMRFARA